MKPKPSALLIALILATTGASVAAPDESDATVLGRAGTRQVFYGDVRQVIDPLLQKTHEGLSSREVEDWLPVFRSAVMREVILAEVRENGWESTSAAQLAVKRAKEDALIESFLAASTEVPEGYPSEAEVRRAYENGIDAFMVPEQWHLAQIFISLGPEASEEAKIRVDTILSTLRQRLSEPDIDFMALAREWSEEPLSRENGGVIGWLREDQLVHELRPEVIALRAGEVAGPIRLSNGWHWIYATDYRPAGPLEYNQVSGLIRARLKQEREQRNREVYLERLLDRNPIALDQRVVRRLLEQK